MRGSLPASRALATMSKQNVLDNSTVSRKSLIGKRTLINPTTGDSISAEQESQEDVQRSSLGAKRRSSLTDPLPMIVNILKPNPGRVINK